jgi:predicted transcriptional regulator
MNDRKAEAERYSTYRSKIEIMGSILWSIDRAPKRRTELMQEIGITSRQLDRYIAWLSDSDIRLARIDKVGHKREYAITDKGRDALRAYEKLMSLVERSHASDEP